MSDYDRSSAGLPSEPKRGPFPNAEEPVRLGRFNPKSRKPVSRLIGDVTTDTLLTSISQARQ